LTHGPSRVDNSAMKTGRNSPCDCGSGKKYKNCCEGLERRKLERRTRAIGLALTAVATGGLIAAGYTLLSG